MFDERQESLERLFHQVADLTTGEREAKLHELCDDPLVRAEVLELLQFDQSPRDGSTHRPGGGIGDNINDDFPTRIGNYRLLQRIGEGGMGVVYMAEQLEPVRRRVALKIVRPGMDSKQVIARFEAERQALALMDHPNIAKVLDAGATESDRPYFVMELVKGVPITHYSDQKRLSTHDRLRLFVTVCRAVQHAHHKGIIHRDLKPSNVLVADYDEQPVPKVIDFGVAKATDQELTTKTLYTQFGQIVGTLEYMSPEQAKLNQLDVDTRSDIYSLGILLYELLTGGTPIDHESLKSSALDEILRCIREDAPPRPSVRLSSSATLPAIAARRDTEPGDLVVQLKDDLDWIVIKALAKEREHRYQTAEAFAADIERHLNDLPIEARPPSLLRRTRRFVRRHQTTVTLTGLILVASLTAAVLGSIAFVENLQRSRQQAVLDATEARAEIARLEAERRETARTIDMPRVKRLTEQNRVVEAFLLAEAIRGVLPNDPALDELSEALSERVTFRVTPEGARIYYRDAYDADADWILAGEAPLIDARLPKCELRFRLVSPGYITREFQRPFPAFLEHDSQFTLRAEQGDPEGMVHVSAIQTAWWNRLRNDLDEYFIDRFEVTNAEYQAFVDAGGYETPEYWREVEFVRDGESLTWEQAIRSFVDASGSLGPAGWHDGRFPTGLDDFPVVGVSWYEAAAYAKFVGKHLPSVDHWTWAANSENVGVTMALSNFSNRGLSPRGAHNGIGRFEVYDLAGNAKEWCWNENEDGLRYVKGGAWNESEYKYTTDDYASPWDRDPATGFRCVSFVNGKLPSEEVFAVVPKHVRVHNEIAREPIEALRKWYQFDRVPLNAAQIQLDDAEPSPDFRHEVVHVDAAYSDERLVIHLMIPRQPQDKYETVVWVPGIDRWNSGGEFSLDVYHDMKYVAELPKTGRIVCHPIYAGTFQRFSGLAFYDHFHEFPLRARDEFIAVSKDISRAVDYLLTRDDVDPTRLVYFGHSLGAFRGPATLVTDGRFSAAVLLAGGYVGNLDELPEIDNYQFTPHVKTPVLMINGIRDNVADYESSQLPCYNDLGSAIKHHEPLESGHNPSAEQVYDVMTKWLHRLFTGAAVDGQSSH